MNILSSDDLNLFDTRSVAIIANAQKLQNELLEPTMSESIKVRDIILDYCKQNKRKLYGGFAVNTLIIDKNPQDAFYSDLDRPDFDIYSPDPIQDIINVCNILHKQGFKHVNASEAQHSGTYKIFQNFKEYCDFTYVPNNIYNRLPFKEINGLLISHPIWITIDYFRIFTDPSISYRILPKAFKRFYLLQKYYPLPTNNTTVSFPKLSSDVHSLINLVYEYVNNKSSIILIGYNAYNYFVKKSGILDKKKSDIQYIIPPFVEFISSNFKTDVLDLFNVLKENNQDIIIKEYYPFFQFYGHNAIIFLNDKPIVHIYNNNDRCTPYIKTLNFRDENDKYVKIGSFDNQILYFLIFLIKERVEKNKKGVDVYYALLNNMFHLRKYYFARSGKTLYDESFFQSFVIDCDGTPVDPNRRKRLLAAIKRKKKQRTEYRYDPEVGGEKPDYKYPNSSGNEVRNQKNLKLTKGIMMDDIMDYDDDELEEIIDNKNDSSQDSTDSDSVDNS